MNNDDINAVLDGLVRIPDNEVGNWEDVLARAGVPDRSTYKSNDSRDRGGGWSWSTRTSIMWLAPTAVAVMIALTVVSPWRGGPTILARATAAVPTPTSSQILYEDIVVHRGSSSDSRRSAMHLQVWLAGAAPHRFRVVIDDPSLPGPVDVGGMVGTAEGLSYNNTFRVLDPVPFQSRIIEADLNPGAFIRAAVKSGRAHPDGTSTIAGRQVIRIAVTSHLSGRPVGTTLYFVDAQTYEPVRVMVDAAVPNGSALGFPMASLVALPYGQFPEPKSPYVLVFDFAKFRYLTPTAKNHGLTDIQMQYPAAKIA